MQRKAIFVESYPSFEQPEPSAYLSRLGRSLAFSASFSMLLATWFSLILLARADSPEEQRAKHLTLLVGLAFWCLGYLLWIAVGMIQVRQNPRDPLRPWYHNVLTGIFYFSASLLVGSLSVFWDGFFLWLPTGIVSLIVLFTGANRKQKEAALSYLIGYGLVFLGNFIYYGIVASLKSGH